jgi:hypothetical protein
MPGSRRGEQRVFLNEKGADHEIEEGSAGGHLQIDFKHAQWLTLPPVPLQSSSRCPQGNHWRERKKERNLLFRS